MSLDKCSSALPLVELAVKKNIPGTDLDELLQNHIMPALRWGQLIINSFNSVNPHRTAVLSLAYLNTSHNHHRQPYCSPCLLDERSLYRHTVSTISSMKIKFSLVFTILKYTLASESYNQTKQTASFIDYNNKYS